MIDVGPDGTDAGSSPPIGFAVGPARSIAILVGLLLVAFTAALAFGPTAAADDDSGLVGKRAPMTVGSVPGGRPFDIDEYRGSSWVLVNFFATWCAPCVAEHDDLVELEAWGAERGDLQLVAAVFNDSPDRVATFFDQRGGAWPVLDEPEIPINYKVSTVPESFLVSPAGQVVFHVEGQLTADEVKSVINEAERDG